MGQPLERPHKAAIVEHDQIGAAFANNPRQAKRLQRQARDAAHLEALDGEDLHTRRPEAIHEVEACRHDRDGGDTPARKHAQGGEEGFGHAAA